MSVSTSLDSPSPSRSPVGLITTALVGPAESDSDSTSPYASVWTAVTEYTLPIDAQAAVGVQAGIV